MTDTKTKGMQEELYHHFSNKHSRKRQ